MLGNHRPKWKLGRQSEPIDTLVPLLPALASAEDSERITPRQLFSCLTVESLCLMIERHAPKKCHRDGPAAGGTVTAKDIDVSDADAKLSSEQKMRRTFEARRGAAFTDEEWEEAKRNLVGVFLMIGTRDVTPSDDEPDD